MTKHPAWLFWASVLWGCGSTSESPFSEADAGASMGGTATTAAASANTSSSNAATSSGTVSAASNAVTSNGTTTGARTASDGSSSASDGSTATAAGGASSSGAGGSSGSAGDGGSSTQGGASGAGGGSTTSTGNTSSGGGNAGRTPCESDADCGVFNCCGGYCVNLRNDILNCGACGDTCEGEAPYCSSGSCGDPPCSDGVCAAGTSCCGSECCGAGELCCAVNMGPSVLGCFEPEFGTCPMGCGACACASPDTAIATPEGERSIAELAVGDLVYSVDDEQIRAVPIAALNRVPVLQHHVLQVGFADGSAFEMSGKHPTADGRTLSDLNLGERLDGKTVTQLSWKAYRHSHTYDILPASSSGAYFASGVLVGSTLKGDGSCLNCGSANAP